MIVIAFPDRTATVPPRPSALAPTCLVDLLPRYEAVLRSAKRRDRGVKLYLWLARRFFATLPNGATNADLTEAAIRRYQESIGVRCAASTVENALYGIRRFCRWAMQEGLRDDDPTEHLEWPRVTITVPDRLTEAEIRALLARCKAAPARMTRRARWRWARNHRAVALMLYAGLRLAETAALKWKDVDLDAGELVVRSESAKGGDERRVSINARLRTCLLAVPEEERAPHAGVIPVAPGGAPMSFKGLERVFDRWPPLALSAHAHQLRHTFATRMHRRGVPVRTIQALLGHKSLETTMRYLGIDPEDTAAAVAVLDW